MNEDVRARAESLVRSYPLVDGHIDLPNRLRTFYENPAEKTIGGDVDYPRARAGGLNAPFMSIFIPTSLQDTPGAAKQRAHRLIDIVERLGHEHSDQFSLATSPEEVRRIAQTDALALPMGLENGAAIEGDLRSLTHLYRRGIRYVTLTHGAHNRIGDSSYDDSPPRWGGLSPFGESVVAEMNRLGVMVDLSHVTDSTANDVLEQTKAPVIASHSSCRRFTPGWERNLSDELIEGIADTDGIIMIPFGSTFLREEYREQDDSLQDEVETHIEATGWADDSRLALAYKQRMRKKHPIGRVTDAADHIDHVVHLVGVDHVGLGSDFEGVFSLPKGLQDVSTYPNLVVELLRRGYADCEIAQILGENLLRVWEEVGRIAQK